MVTAVLTDTTDDKALCIVRVKWRLIVDDAARMGKLEILVKFFFYRKT